MKDVATSEKRRGGGKQPVIRRCPNGETHPAVSEDEFSNFILQINFCIYGWETGQ